MAYISSLAVVEMTQAYISGFAVVVVLHQRPGQAVVGYLGDQLVIAGSDQHIPGCQVTVHYLKTYTITIDAINHFYTE